MEWNSLRRKMARGSRRIRAVHGEVENGVVDGAGDPAPDAALRGIPLRIIRLRRNGAVDVRAKAELAAQRFEEECPLRIVGLEIQRDRNVSFDVDRGIGMSHDRGKERSNLAANGR
jgi:hypothetical protein